MAGSLPQGAHTSPGLGNLIFWDREPQIEQRIRNLGFTYTRYVDDVTISTNRFVRMSELQSVISPVVGMLSSKGVRPHRGQDKLVIATPGYQRQVHGLNVGSGALTMDRRDRAKIRAAVHQCELQAQAGLNAIEYARNWLSVNGRIEWLRLFHPTPAEQYQDRMNAIKPVLSEELFDEVEGDVNTLEQLASAWTLPFDYRREYKKVSRRVNTLQAYYPGKFSPLIQRLRLLSEN